MTNRIFVLRHNEFDELLNLLVRHGVINQDFFKLIREIISDRTDGKTALFKNKTWTLSLVVSLFDDFPKTSQVCKIFMNLFCVTLGACGANNGPKSLGYRHIRHNLFEALAIFIRNFPADSRLVTL